MFEYPHTGCGDAFCMTAALHCLLEECDEHCAFTTLQDLALEVIRGELCRLLMLVCLAGTQNTCFLLAPYHPLHVAQLWCALGHGPETQFVPIHPTTCHASTMHVLLCYCVLWTTVFEVCTFWHW